MKAKKKEPTPMEKLTEGYEAFINGKQLNPKGKELFEKVIKKATKVKRRSAK